MTDASQLRNHKLIGTNTASDFKRCLTKKSTGREITVAPPAPPPHGQVIDLMQALKEAEHGTGKAKTKSSHSAEEAKDCFLTAFST